MNSIPLTILRLYVAVISMWGSVAVGGTNESLSELRSVPFDWGQAGSGPLCGVYAACRAMASIGVIASPSDLINSKAVSSAAGSTPSDIQRIVAAYGLKGTVMRHLSLIDITWSGKPVILNVRSTTSSKKYNHWVTVINAEEGLYLYDGTKPGMSISSAELLGIWSGLGIVVADSQSPEYLKAILRRTLAWGAIGFSASLIVLILRQATVYVISGCELRGSSLLQSTTISMVGILVTVLACFCFGDIQNSSTAAQIASAPFAGRDTEFVGLSELSLSAADSSILLVDARYPDDFVQGTLPGAINIPAYASDLLIRKFLATVQHDTRIVVFCHSDRCSFDESVAEQLIAIGFTNVAASKVGWVEYSEQL